MEKKKMTLKIGLMAGLMSLVASPAFAKTVSLKDAGVALWIFAVIGAFIVLMQLIPAAILFFSFVGTATTLAIKKEKKAEEEVLLPGVEPVPVKK
jgi:membrane associated rhomboid family serine protease